VDTLVFLEEQMNHPEDNELIKYFDWVRWNENSDERFKTIYHVENERRTSIQAGVRRKRKGVRSGVFDIIIPLDKGMAIEMKIKPNKLSKNQIDWATLMGNYGYDIRVAYSADEAIEFTKQHLGIK